MLGLYFVTFCLWMTVCHAQCSDFNCNKLLVCDNDPCDCQESNLNCRSNTCHSNGCSQCLDGYFKKDWNYKCVHCQDTFGDDCMHCADIHGCQQCRTGQRKQSTECGVYYCDTGNNNNNNNNNENCDPTPATNQPTSRPNDRPNDRPTRRPNNRPTRRPTEKPSDRPSFMPTTLPTDNPTMNPSTKPPTDHPTVDPTTSAPSARPSTNPTLLPSNNPTVNPSLNPSMNPSTNPSTNPSVKPSANPSMSPTTTNAPTKNPTSMPTMRPNTDPTHYPTTSSPSVNPTAVPTLMPTTSLPTNTPTVLPTTLKPSDDPTMTPSSLNPTMNPTKQPSAKPTIAPSMNPTSMQPSTVPTTQPTEKITTTTMDDTDTDTDTDTKTIITDDWAPTPAPTAVYAEPTQLPIAITSHQPTVNPTTTIAVTTTTTTTTTTAVPVASTTTQGSNDPVSSTNDDDSEWANTFNETADGIFSSTMNTLVTPNNSSDNTSCVADCIMVSGINNTVLNNLGFISMMQGNYCYENIYNESFYIYENDGSGYSNNYTDNNNHNNSILFSNILDINENGYILFEIEYFGTLLFQMYYSIPWTQFYPNDTNGDLFGCDAIDQFFETYANGTWLFMAGELQDQLKDETATISQFEFRDCVGVDPFTCQENGTKSVKIGKLMWIAINYWTIALVFCNFVKF